MRQKKKTRFKNSNFLLSSIKHPASSISLPVICCLSLVACLSVDAEEQNVEQEVHGFSFEGYGDKGIKQW